MAKENNSRNKSNQISLLGFAQGKLSTAPLTIRL
jgi:hypothetical protein